MRGEPEGCPLGNLPLSKGRGRSSAPAMRSKRGKTQTAPASPPSRLVLIQAPAVTPARSTTDPANLPAAKLQDSSCRAVPLNRAPPSPPIPSPWRERARVRGRLVPVASPSLPTNLPCRTPLLAARESPFKESRVSRGAVHPERRRRAHAGGLGAEPPYPMLEARGVSPRKPLSLLGGGGGVAR